MHKTSLHRAGNPFDAHHESRASVHSSTEHSSYSGLQGQLTSLHNELTHITDLKVTFLGAALKQFEPLIDQEEYDVPWSHAHKGRHETSVESGEPFVAHGNSKAVHSRFVYSDGGV